jgi:hypothetical protein
LNDFSLQEIVESQTANGEDLDPSRFPELSTLSSAFFYQFTPVAKSPASPEIVFVPTSKAKRQELAGILSTWNFLWEASQYRREVFREDRYAADLPELASWINSLPEANIYLVADTKTKYDAYAPLYHLLPKRLLDRYGLPALKRPFWPNNSVRPWNDEGVLPINLPQRLSRAFADHVWRYIDSGSGIRAFSSSEPLIVLSHSLDFWLPSAIRVIEDRMRIFDRVEPETQKQRELLTQAQRENDPDVAVERPRMGGTLWMGEDEAAEVTEEVVNTADRNGQLRGIIEAVKANRVVDDFSSCWSYAREDFERKLYSKRAKVRISFVELNGTLPVHSPRSEFTDDLLWQDFSALLDVRERHIVVCLRNGPTKLGDIAASLGYANHSPISKALVRIRKKAAAFLDLKQPRIG